MICRNFKTYIVRLLPAIIIAACCLSFTIHKNGETDLQEKRLQGRVKFMAEVLYSVSGDTSLKIADGGIENADTTWFNDKGYIIQSNHRSYLKVFSDYAIKNTTYTCNETGRKTSGINTWLGRLKSVDIDSFQYDRYGNDTLDLFYTQAGKLRGTRITKYDNLGRIIKIQNTLTGQKITPINIAYNDQNHTSLNGTLRETYNGDGNTIEKDFLDKQGNIKYKNIITYDKYGNTLTERESDVKDSISVWHKYNYEYDKEGNWIKETCIEDHKTKLIRRTILYY